MKRISSLLLAIVMLLSLTAGLSISAFAETSGDFEYSVLDDGTAAITGYTGEATALTIPTELDGHTVTRIDYMAFMYCASLTEIVLPDSVTHIDARAFAFCENLESVKMPDGLTYLSSSAFEVCSSLKSIVIPAGVKEMEFYQFSNCDSLDSFYIMNKDLVFGESRWPRENATIYGYEGSTAQAYANENGIKFVAIEEEVEEPETEPSTEETTTKAPTTDTSTTEATTTEPSTEETATEAPTTQPTTEATTQKPTTETATQKPTTEKTTAKSSTEASAADKKDTSKSPDTGAAEKGLYAIAAIALACGAVAFVKKKEQ